MNVEGCGMNLGGKCGQEFHLAGLCVDHRRKLDMVQVHWDIE